MTRESKLALIVGFGLVLFVGILVSDHFSAGQRQEAAHLLAQRGGVRHQESAISIQSLQPAIQQVRGGDARASVEGGERAADHVTDRALAGGRNDADVEIGFTGRGGQGERSDRHQIGAGPTPGAGSGGAAVSAAHVAAGEAPNPPSAAGAPSTPGTQEVAGVRLYPVKEGETLYSICAAHYGNAALWQALAEFNKSAVPNPARMRKGVTLRLPPMDVLKPGASGGASGSESPSRAARGESMVRLTGNDASPRSEVTSYTVKRGETLVRIAEKTLGSSSRWEEIARLNRDVIPDPHAIAPGMVLRVPTG